MCLMAKPMARVTLPRATGAALGPPKGGFGCPLLLSRCKPQYPMRRSPEGRFWMQLPAAPVSLAASRSVQCGGASTAEGTAEGTAKARRGCRWQMRVATPFYLAEQSCR